MEQFQVVDVIDGTTIKVHPKWVLRDLNGATVSGDTVTILGYTSPSTDRHEALYLKIKLEKLLLYENVTLKNPHIIRPSNYQAVKVACSVYLKDVDISNYFSDYKENKASMDLEYA